MQVIQVEVKNDHLRRLATSKKPMTAISELIWNGLDAEASNVDVSLGVNGLGGVDWIEISDDGHGVFFDDVNKLFGGLGGSWKNEREFTANKKRPLHGKTGKGRFHAFCLGGVVEWKTRFDSGQINEYAIHGEFDKIGHFEVTTPVVVDSETSTGTTIRIEGTRADLGVLLSKDIIAELTEEFAMYLLLFPDVRITFNGTKLDLKSLIENQASRTLAPSTESGALQGKEVRLDAIQWKSSVDKSCHIVDSDGHELLKIQLPIKTPDFYYSVLLKSPVFDELAAKNELLLGEFDNSINELIDKVAKVIKQVYQQMLANKQNALVEEWKEQQIYPYSETDDSQRRECFDFCAKVVNDRLPGFGRASIENRKLLFQLIKNTVETSPGALNGILDNVMSVPKEKIRQLNSFVKKIKD